MLAIDPSDEIDSVQLLLKKSKAITHSKKNKNKRLNKQLAKEDGSFREEYTMPIIYREKSERRGEQERSYASPQKAPWQNWRTVTKKMMKTTATKKTMMQMTATKKTMMQMTASNKTKTKDKHKEPDGGLSRVIYREERAKRRKKRSSASPQKAPEQNWRTVKKMTMMKTTTTKTKKKSRMKSQMVRVG